MLGDVNKLFVFKNTQQFFSLHLKQTSLPIIWIFTEGEGDGIESRLPLEIFSILKADNRYFQNIAMQNTPAFSRNLKALCKYVFRYWEYVSILMYQSLNWRHTYMKKGDPKNQLRSDSRMQNALPFTKIYDNRSVSSSSHMQNSNP